ncbi:MAG: crotonase/enoyl-CoA hydratase family protein, partial [Myxococcota bacterium]
FCAGFDLNEFKKGPAETYALLRKGAKLMLDIFRHPQPVVMGCTGHAVAGGALLLLTGDTRIGIEGDFKLGLNETAIGMVVPDFGLALAQHRLSRRYLQASVIQSRMYDPTGARDAGFLDEVVPPDEVKAQTLATAQALAQLSGEAYAGNKMAIRSSTIKALEASFEQLNAH